MNILPTIVQLTDGVIASMNAQFGITIPTTKSFLRDLATVWGGKIKLLYLFIGFVQKNVWWDLADPVALGGTLERFGFSFLQRLPYAATQGQYICAVSGTSGATIPANTTYLSDPTSLNPNILFILDTAYVLTGSGDMITLRATVAGSIANLAVANTLTCTKPLVNVLPGATVSSISVSAIDAETPDEYRNAIQQNVLLAPQGGAVPDYIVWASPVAGVANVYPYAASGAVWEEDVFIEAILSDSGGIAPDYNFGIPTPTIIANATAAILNDPITGMGRKPNGVVLGPMGAIITTVINNTGGNYNPGDLGTISTGTTLAVYQILTVAPSSGRVITYLILSMGSGYSVSTNVATVATTGGGSGFTVDITAVNTTGTALPVSVYQVAIAFTGTTGMSVAQKNLITEALQQAVSNIRPFIGGANALANQNDTLSINLPASGGRLAPPENYVVIVIAMAAAPGAIFTGCTMTVNGISETTYTFDNGIIPYLQASNVTFA